MLFKEQYPRWRNFRADTVVFFHPCVNLLFLNLPIKIMELTDPDVAAMNAECKKENMKRVVGWFHRYRDKLRVKDVEAAAVIVGLAMEVVVHTITISHPPVQPERLISELADMLSKYLFRKEAVL